MCLWFVIHIEREDLRAQSIQSFFASEKWETSLGSRKESIQLSSIFLFYAFCFFLISTSERLLAAFLTDNWSRNGIEQSSKKSFLKTKTKIIEWERFRDLQGPKWSVPFRQVKFDKITCNILRDKFNPGVHQAFSRWSHLNHSSPCLCSLMELGHSPKMLLGFRILKSWNCSDADRTRLHKSWGSSPPPPPHGAHQGMPSFPSPTALGAGNISALLTVKC